MAVDRCVGARHAASSRRCSSWGADPGTRRATEQVRNASGDGVRPRWAAGSGQWAVGSRQYLSRVWDGVTMAGRVITKRQGHGSFPPSGGPCPGLHSKSLLAARWPLESRRPAGFFKALPLPTDALLSHQLFVIHHSKVSVQQTGKASSPSSSSSRTRSTAGAGKAMRDRSLRRRGRRPP
jgi:hypothetical protein